MWFIPIRLRISILVAGAVSVSLFSYVYVGTRLIREDKLSYIYDFSLAQVQSAALHLEQRIESVRRTGILLASLPDGSAISIASVDRALSNLGATAAVVARTNGVALETRLKSGADADRLEKKIQEIPWTRASDSERNVVILTDGAEALIAGFRIGLDEKGAPVFFAARLSLGSAGFPTVSNAIRLQLLDRERVPVPVSGDFARSGMTMEETRRIAEKALGGVFNSGVTEVTDESTGWIAAYHRISGGELTVLGLISRDEAFSAMRTLALRSSLIGLSIFFLTIGLTLTFVRSLTRRLRGLWDATRKVSEGDFTVRVQPTRGERIRDEISDLSGSFDAMAGKIEMLLRETAEKARMESELETARLVQKRLFPRVASDEGRFRIAGHCLPASECAGDWWQYVRKKNRLYVIIGDVTGHGASAALVAAAAHGAFSTVMANAEPVSITSLLNALNTAVHAAAHGESTMTCFVSVLDLDTGIMETVNASHRPAYLHRRTDGKPALKPLSLADGKPLGAGPALEFNVQRTRLLPGDVILWYTDGLLELSNPAGDSISSVRLSRKIAELTAPEIRSEDPERFCAAIIDWAREFWDNREKDLLEDDVTLVTGLVPAAAVFPVESDDPSEEGSARQSA